MGESGRKGERTQPGYELNQGTFLLFFAYFESTHGALSIGICHVIGARIL